MLKIKTAASLGVLLTLTAPACAAPICFDAKELAGQPQVATPFTTASGLVIYTGRDPDTLTFTNDVPNPLSGKSYDWLNWHKTNLLWISAAKPFNQIQVTIVSIQKAPIALTLSDKPTDPTKTRLTTVTKPYAGPDPYTLTVRQTGSTAAALIDYGNELGLMKVCVR